MSVRYGHNGDEPSLIERELCYEELRKKSASMADVPSKDITDHLLGMADEMCGFTKTVKPIVSEPSIFTKHDNYSCETYYGMVLLSRMTSAAVSEEERAQLLTIYERVVESIRSYESDDAPEETTAYRRRNVAKLYNHAWSLRLDQGKPPLDEPIDPVRRQSREMMFNRMMAETRALRRACAL